MMRCIDADDLIQWIKDVWNWESIDNIPSSIVLKQTISDIENQPTIYINEEGK